MTRRIFSPRIADERFARVAGVSQAVGGENDVRVVCAYSVKTNPHERMLDAARRHGYRAEVISDNEAELAESLGFAPRDLIYNGPRPPAPRRERYGFVFADSLESFARLCELRLADRIGIRFRPTMLRNSRFGIAIEEDDALLAQLRDLEAPVAVSMHARRADYGSATWRDLCEDLVLRAMRIEREAGCSIVAFDVGGGWQPHQFDRDFPDDGRWLIDRLRAALPSVRTVLIEPGQAIATPVESILTTVLEVRRRPGRLEAVVDLGHGDWPSQHEYVHELALARRGDWVPIGSGGDRLSGSTCLEYDCIDGLRFPRDIAVGDGLLVRNTGSYDRSMAFRFGRGVLPEVSREEVEA
jgi:diaminopimelate decarboxylase